MILLDEVDDDSNRPLKHQEMRQVPVSVRQSVSSSDTTLGRSPSPVSLHSESSTYVSNPEFGNSQARLNLLDPSRRVKRRERHTDTSDRRRFWMAVLVALLIYIALTAVIGVPIFVIASPSFICLCTTLLTTQFFLKQRHRIEEMAAAGITATVLVYVTVSAAAAGTSRPSRAATHTGVISTTAQGSSSPLSTTTFYSGVVSSYSSYIDIPGATSVSMEVPSTSYTWVMTATGTATTGSVSAFIDATTITSAVAASSFVSASPMTTSIAHRREESPSMVASTERDPREWRSRIRKG
jgi:hypothetical protein